MKRKIFAIFVIAILVALSFNYFCTNPVLKLPVLALYGPNVLVTPASFPASMAESAAHRPLDLQYNLNDLDDLTLLMEVNDPCERSRGCRRLTKHRNPLITLLSSSHGSYCALHRRLS